MTAYEETGYAYQYATHYARKDVEGLVDTKV